MKLPHRRIAVLVGLVSVVPALASASPDYQLFYGNPTIVDTNTTTPQRVTHASATGTASYAEHCYAIPGQVLAHVRVEGSGAASDQANVYGRTDDFIITGPSGPATVNATVHFMLHLDLEHAGAATDNSTRAYGQFFFETDHDQMFEFVAGSATSGNGGSAGSDALAAYAGGAVDAPVSFTATLPVGAPAGMHLNVNVAAETFLPGIVDATFAGVLGDASGHVMDLPAGYTVSSASWGVVDNVATGAVASVPGASTDGLALGAIAPNPSAGAATLAYALPHRGEARLEILDLQGRVVRVLASGVRDAGAQRATWDGRAASGARATPGVYFARLGFEGRSVTRRITRLE